MREFEIHFVGFSKNDVKPIVKVMPAVRAKDEEQAIAIAKAEYSRNQQEWESYSNCYISHENA